MPTTPPKRGIPCPNCQGRWLKVLRTRNPRPGVKLREIGCVECGVKHVTREDMMPAMEKKATKGEK